MHGLSSPTCWGDYYALLLFLLFINKPRTLIMLCYDHLFTTVIAMDI